MRHYIPEAATSLFVVFTGNWADFFSETYADDACWSADQPPAELGPPADCATRVSTIPFFFSFVVVAVFLLNNIVVAIVLERFSSCVGVDQAGTVAEYARHVIR